MSKENQESRQKNIRRHRIFPQEEEKLKKIMRNPQNFKEVFQIIKPVRFENKNQNRLQQENPYNYYQPQRKVLTPKASSNNFFNNREVHNTTINFERSNQVNNEMIRLPVNDRSVSKEQTSPVKINNRSMNNKECIKILQEHICNEQDVLQNILAEKYINVNLPPPPKRQQQCTRYDTKQSLEHDLSKFKHGIKNIMQNQQRLKKNINQIHEPNYDFVATNRNPFTPKQTTKQTPQQFSFTRKVQSGTILINQIRQQITNMFTLVNPNIHRYTPNQPY